MTVPDTTAEADRDALYCPSCAYDLRMTAEGRCPECGTLFDRATLRVSRIPWTHRRARGRVNAWRKTVWMVIRSPKTLSDEVAFPVSWRDANRFRWSVIWIVSLMSGLAATLLYRWLGPRLPRIDYQNWVYSLFTTSSDPRLSPWLFPLTVSGPGAIILLMLCTFAAGLCISWWIRLWFWAYGGTHRERASALSCYMMTWWLAAGIMGVLDLTFFTLDTPALSYSLERVVFLLLVAINLLILGCWWSMLLVLLRRTTGCSLRRSSVAAITIPGGIILIPCACVIILAYVCGLAAIIAASLF